MVSIRVIASFLAYSV